MQTAKIPMLRLFVTSIVLVGWLSGLQAQDLGDPGSVVLPAPPMDSLIVPQTPIVAPPVVGPVIVVIIRNTGTWVGTSPADGFFIATAKANVMNQIEFTLAAASHLAAGRMLVIADTDIDVDQNIHWVGGIIPIWTTEVTVTYTCSSVPIP